jgi:hypothetical protein
MHVEEGSKRPSLCSLHAWTRHHSHTQCWLIGVRSSWWARRAAAACMQRPRARPVDRKFWKRVAAGRWGWERPGGSRSARPRGAESLATDTPGKGGTKHVARVWSTMSQYTYDRVVVERERRDKSFRPRTASVQTRLLCRRRLSVVRTSSIGQLVALHGAPGRLSMDQRSDRSASRAAARVHDCSRAQRGESVTAWPLPASGSCWPDRGRRGRLIARSRRAAAASSPPPVIGAADRRISIRLCRVPIGRRRSRSVGLRLYFRSSLLHGPKMNKLCC